MRMYLRMSRFSLCVYMHVCVCIYKDYIYIYIYIYIHTYICDLAVMRCNIYIHTYYIHTHICDRMIGMAMPLCYADVILYVYTHIHM
jgi:hypothetical protein